MNLEGDALAYPVEDFAEPIAGDTAANGIKFGNEGVEAVSEFG
jgi:hypothetical protein